MFVARELLFFIHEIDEFFRSIKCTSDLNEAGTASSLSFVGKRTSSLSLFHFSGEIFVFHRVGTAAEDYPGAGYNGVTSSPGDGWSLVRIKRLIRACKE